MPSGSRRKKASKKKKGNDSNNIKSSATLQSAENEDLTNQEERDSDGGENEAVSPLCEGNNQDQFPEAGSELENREELPPVRSVASGNISLEGDTVDSKEVQIVGLDSEGNGILEENVKEMKLEDAPESVSVNESVEVLTNGYLEERNGIDLNGEPEFDVESELVKPESAVLEAPESGDSVVDSLFTSFDKVIHDATDVAPIDSGWDLKENGEKELKPRDHSSEFGHNVLDVSSEVEEVVESVTDVPDRVVHVTEPAPNETILVSASDLRENKDKDLQTRDYSSQLSQTPLEISSTVDEYILYDSVPDVETCLDKVESIDLASEKVIHVSETAPVESMVNSGSVLMENGEEIVAPFKSSIGFDEATISEKVIYVNGTAPTEKVNEGLHTGDCSAQTPDILLDNSSKVQESAAKVSSFSAKDEAREKDDRSLPISDSSTVRASSSVESSKEPESCEISENQTLIGTAPRHVEKSSWFGCCGIFDLISGTR